MKIFICLSLLLALALASPVERQSEGSMVVDVPAGAFEPESEEIRPQTGRAEQEQVEVVEKDSKEAGNVPGRDPDADFFGFRFPTFPSMFVYRRPVIRDPFSSFSGFQPQPYAPGQFDAFSHMEAMMQRMQQQMSSLWGALLNRGYAMRPRPPVEVVEPLVPVETPAVVDEKSVIKIDELPANYTNTTSETKEIDGHVVEVNKTIHKITSNDSSGFFHFQVIKIRPKEEAVTEAPTGSVPTEVAHESAGSSPTESKPESVAPSEQAEGTQQTTTHKEDPSMNEVDAQQERQQEKLVDSFPFLLNRFKEEYTVDGGVSADGKLGKLEEELDIIPHDHPLGKLERREADLSGDIRINKILEEQNRKAQLRMINSDAEIFFP